MADRKPQHLAVPTVETIKKNLAAQAALQANPNEKS